MAVARSEMRIETDGSVAFTAVVMLLARRAWLILTLALVGGVVGFATAQVLPRQYEIEAILAPAQNAGVLAGSGVAGQLARLGGLGLAGSSNTNAALGLMNSRGLCRRFALQVNLLADLFPPREPSLKQRILGATKPTIDDACRYFHANVFTADSNELTGLVTVRVRWGDSAKAASWINTIVDMTNADMQSGTIAEAAGALHALQGQLDSAPPVKVQEAIYSLIEQQLGRIAAAKGSPQYALTVLDRAEPKEPQDYDFPSRALFTFTGLGLGALLATLIIAIRASLAVRLPTA